MPVTSTSTTARSEIIEQGKIFGNATALAYCLNSRSNCIRVIEPLFGLKLMF